MDGRTPASRVRVVLAVGAHRSGTSALARVLSLLGCRLPPNLLPPAADNPTGFWEPSEVVAIHDELLVGLERRWDDPRSLPDGWVESPSGRAARSALGTCLDRWLANDALLVIKDPRTSRLLPLWLALLDDRELPVAVALTARPPEEVARSMRRREGTALDAAGWLWLVSILEAEHATRGRTRVVVSYADLLAEPDAASRRLAAGVGLPSPSAAAISAITAFLDPSLRHAEDDGESFHPALAPLLEQVHRAVVAGDGPDLAALDDARQQVIAQPLAGVAFASARRSEQYQRAEAVRISYEQKLEHAHHVEAALRAEAERGRLDVHEVRTALEETRAHLREIADQLGIAGAAVEESRRDVAVQRADAEEARRELDRALAARDARERQTRRTISLRHAIGRRSRPGRPEPGNEPAGERAANPDDLAFVVVVERGSLEWQSVLFVDSLRRWGGAASRAAIYAVSPRPDRRPCRSTVRELEGMGANYVDAVENTDTSGYGAVNRIVAGAYIERSTTHEILVVADSDTLVLGPLDALMLAEDVDFAARPVDLVGTATTRDGDDAMTPYWRGVCALAGIELADLPVTTSTVDGVEILADYNGGLVSTRRSVGILQGVEELYGRAESAGLRPRPGAPAFRAGAGPVSAPAAARFGSSQVALAVSAWRLTRRIEELPPTYNVPLHLLDELPETALDHTFRTATHVHYHWLLDDDQPLDPLRARRDSPLTAYQRWWLEARLRWRGSQFRPMEESTT